jgi:hypothetical protein
VISRRRSQTPSKEDSRVSIRPRQQALLFVGCIGAFPQPQPRAIRWPSTVSGSGLSPKPMGLYCLLNLIFCGTPASFQGEYRDLADRFDPKLKRRSQAMPPSYIPNPAFQRPLPTEPGYRLPIKVLDVPRYLCSFEVFCPKRRTCRGLSYSQPDTLSTSKTSRPLFLDCGLVASTFASVAVQSRLHNTNHYPLLGNLAFERAHRRAIRGSFAEFGFVLRCPEDWEGWRWRALSLRYRTSHEGSSPCAR